MTHSKMHKLLQKFVSVGMLGFLASSLTSCATRTVVLDPRVDVVRLGPDVVGRVYVFSDGKWTLTKPIKLPEGWYAGPGPSQ